MKDFIIKHSKLGGNGLFSERSFGKNTVLMRLDGEKLTGKQVSALSMQSANNVLQIGNDLYLDFSGKNHLFINHSCSPNTYIKTMVNTAFLFSAIPINIGDELCFDYSVSSLEDNKISSCNCGSYGCRKIIGSWASLPEAKKARYLELKIVPDFIKNG